MKIKKLHPLISCICITNNRPALLLKSIYYFDQQNYPNTELIISYPKSDDKSRQMLITLKRISNLRIREIEREVSLSIGAARNEAVSVCNGEYVCMWDDDDIYFYSRVADQYNLLQGNGKYFQSSIIPQIYLYDSISEKGYLSFINIWGGTLLCKKSHFQLHPCPDTDKDELSPLINYLESSSLLMKDGLHAHLYTMIYHGQIDEPYFNSLIKNSVLLEDIYTQSISCYYNYNISLAET